MPPTTHREVRLAAARPNTGPVGPEHFEIVDAPVGSPGLGQVLVRNTHLAMRPLMRSLMAGTRLPVPPYVPGEVMWGPAAGEVVEGTAELPAGTPVAHVQGWREYAVCPADRVRVVPEGADPVGQLVQADTAYVGLVGIAGVREGDTVFVSSAAGSVGTMVGQIARLRGAGRVVGSAGSARKVRWLVDELGFDAAFDHREGPVAARLAEAAPDGIDVYFDNVGGEQLQAAVELARPGARIALCGALSGQLGEGADDTAPVLLDSLVLQSRQITVRGFVTSANPELQREGLREVTRWLRRGEITVPVRRFQGLDEAPRALLELLRGEHLGNVIVEL
ncbi:MDR family NADP-dependent oxidoreductase [Pseudonocardia acaciae]|uniref:MDR family NADP-dependent oxidoreductase n=1 Tax=Pseudonocardia acaciae TaxID=551276 RepID=UPI0004917FBB|nr:NADP-dependent oxidoreductase [Pseudonocardia acaciae]